MLLCNLNPYETEPVFAPQKSLDCGCCFTAVNVALEHTSVYILSCATTGRSRDPFELQAYRDWLFSSFTTMSSNTTVKNASPVCTGYFTWSHPILAAGVSAAMFLTWNTNYHFSSIKSLLCELIFMTIAVQEYCCWRSGACCGGNVQGKDFTVSITFSRPLLLLK